LGQPWACGKSSIILDFILNGQQVAKKYLCSGDQRVAPKKTDITNESL
jgi:hypothetical protein